jgi:glycine cleavage system H protein
MKTPDSLRYAASHEWSSEPAEGLVTVGISDFAQDQLGDVVFVELPEVGRTVAAGAAVAVVESVKTASDIYAPLAGEVVAVNEALQDAPETINSDPYGDGWLFQLRVSDASTWGSLLDAAGYAAVAEEG